MRLWICVCVTILPLVSVNSSTLLAQGTYEDEVVAQASAVLSETMAIPASSIPLSLLKNAEGVAILPQVVRGAFLIGVQHGRGVLVMRDEQGAWLAPRFISITGGSLGWQAGIKSTDLVLVFRTRSSLKNLVQGKITIGVDAAAAAGPVGREAAAATDFRLKSEIYSYSRSRGVFAGVSIDGSSLSIDPGAEYRYYHQLGPQPDQPIPESALQLVNQIASYAGSSLSAAPVTFVPQTAAATPANQLSAVKAQLADASKRLSGILSAEWATYLAISAEVFDPQGEASVETIAKTLARYDLVAGDARYTALTSRPEFQTTRALLQELQQLQAAMAREVSLPPPPVAAAGETAVPSPQ